MKRLMLVSALALALAGCYTQETPQPEGLSSFKVRIKGLYTTTTPRRGLPVVSSCARQYGSQDAVPTQVRGTDACRYAIPLGATDIDLEIFAANAQGQVMRSFNGPVSFRVVPGNLAGAYNYRWTMLTNGQGTGTVRASQLYGELHVWVQDEPVEVDYAEGEVVPGNLPQEPATRTFATGLSPTVLFEEPTIASVQTPQNGNQETAYAGTYMRLGRTPESGAVLRQNCEEGDPNNNEPVTLLVTGTDPGGFFVTDITACRVREGVLQGANTQTPEPGGYLPGRFNGLYIYNYSFPEGLDAGDLLWTVAGSVAEFTATTQLTFPSWTVRERVRLLPQSEWNKYLRLVPPVEVNGRLCGYGPSLYVTDPLCGFSYGNYKMEGLESTLVKIRRVKFPRVFQNCDANGNGLVPFFCADTRAGTWAGCGPDSPNDPDLPERQCNINCTLGVGPHAGTVCSEKNTFNTFGQFVVEMNPTGAAEAGLDASVPGRVQTLQAPVDGRPETRQWVGSTEYGPGLQLNIWCDKAAVLRFGGDIMPAAGDVPLAARTLLAHTLTGGQSVVYASAQDEAGGTVSCQLSPNARTRINVVTRDAAPDLKVDCSENDPDAELAQQCRYLHGATFDVTGHLRQVSAARPRWLVLPRDLEDLCCHPGPGMECPKPIAPCANP